jgi:hypothetical protein
MQQPDLANINFALTKAGLTGISGAVTTFSTGASGVLLNFDGKLVQQAQTSGGALPALDSVTGKAFNAVAVNQGSVLVFGYTLAGVIQVAQGSVENLDFAGNFLRAPQMPTLPDGFCPCSYVVLKNGATGTGSFTPGTTVWNQTGMTYSAQDISYIPGRPQIQ